MEISSVRVEAFKSLYDVECDLDHLTVLTGPNGSGKSNFVDALNFLGEVYEDGLEFAVSRAGGYDNIAHRRSRRAKRPIAFTVEVRITKADFTGRNSYIYREEPDEEIPSDFALTYRHSFAFHATGQSVIADFRVVKDTVELIDSKGAVVFSQMRESDSTVTLVDESNRLTASMVRPFGEERYRELFSSRATRTTGVLTEAFDYPNVLWSVRRAIAGTRIFQLSPYQVRRAGVPTPNASLERHGENLPGAANHLRKNDASSWAQVEQAMRAIMPGLSGIDVVYTEDRRLALQFREQGVGRPWNTNEVSDGTIQALALFVALFDRRSLMLVIEEPENAVHPWILRQYIDLCRGIKAKQILMTSHSPVLLNYVDPEIVRLVALAQGKSEVHRLIDLAPEVGKLIIDGELGLFDFYDSGILPMTVPRGFSPDEDMWEE
jgi:predicted ATPase